LAGRRFRIVKIKSFTAESRSSLRYIDEARRYVPRVTNPLLLIEQAFALAG
jgi:hypothetical protein